MTDYKNLNSVPTPPSTPVQTSAVSGTTQTAAKAKPEAASKPAVDQAQISGASTQIAATLQTSDVRMDKVTAIQSAIANGTYNVSATQVADKLIDSMLQ